MTTTPALNDDLVRELNERAASYRLGGPSSEHTAALLEQAAEEIEALRSALEPFAEAEARLRERVEPTWRAGQYANPLDKNAFKWLIFCDAWQTSIASGLTKEAAEEIARAHNDAIAEAAEARLAQAEGGTAVTEAQREAFCRELAMLQYEGGFRDRDVEPYADRLLAALHPQSAAGEDADDEDLPPLDEAFTTAVQALSTYLDATHVEETNWTGWGDQIVPPHATMRRVKAQQSMAALRDSDPLKFAALQERQP